MFRGERSIIPSRWIQHPSYNPSTVDYDFAMVELSTSLTWSKYVQPICLPEPDVLVRHLYCQQSAVISSGVSQAPYCRSLKYILCLVQLRSLSFGLTLCYFSGLLQQGGCSDWMGYHNLWRISGLCAAGGQGGHHQQVRQQGTRVQCAHNRLFAAAGQRVKPQATRAARSPTA